MTYNYSQHLLSCPFKMTKITQVEFEIHLKHCNEPMFRHLFQMIPYEPGYFEITFLGSWGTCDLINEIQIGRGKVLHDKFKLRVWVIQMGLLKKN